MFYEQTDKAIVYLDGKAIDYFSRLKSLVSFDTVNIVQEVAALYRKLGKLVRRVFLALARDVYVANAASRDLCSLDEQWVDEILTGYDPVSKYVFSHEEDRKRARLVEALIASREKEKEIDAALRSVSFMIRIYAVRVTDEAALQAFRDGGFTHVEWVAEHDERTCTVCNKRHGKVYLIGNLPPKPHPNCRCWFIRRA